MNVYLKYIIIWLGFMALIAVATLIVPKIAGLILKLLGKDGSDAQTEERENGDSVQDKTPPKKRKRRSILDPLTKEEIEEASAVEFESREKKQ